MKLSKAFIAVPRIFPLVCGLCMGIYNAAGSMPGDQHWDNQFGPLGASDPLLSVATVGSKVYVGGQLLAAGNTKANYIAGYDGTNWFQLNNGVAGGLGWIYALAASGTNLYIGGSFTNADNSGAWDIGRWDGSNFWPLAGGNPNSYVLTIKIYGTNFFAGGLFTTNGGVQVNGIARWDGSNWKPLGSGISGGAIPNVMSIEYDGTNVYAAGSFTQAGGVNATNVAQWNGTSWSALGSGLGGQVLALARFGGYLYAGGGFTNASLAITNLARWNGTAWSAVGAGPNRVVRDLTTDGTNLYVCGDFSLINGMAAGRIAQWDGTNWWTLGAGIEGFGSGASLGAYKMAFDANHRLYVVGNFNEAGSVAASHVAGWDGTNWFALGGTTSKGVTHFDGDVQALFYDGTNLYAGGIFTDAGDVIVDGVAQWDGTNWHAMGSAAAGVVPSTTSTQVKAFTEGGGELWAGGSFTNIGGTMARNIAMWNGFYWNNEGDADATVRALAFDGNYFWVGGSFTNIGGTYSPGLANNWPDGAWFNYGTVSGGSQAVYAIAVDGSDVYVGGNFTSVGGVGAANIIHWDGFEFVAMGSGVNNTVNAIAAANGTVYVGGTFTTAGGVSVNRIAQWNGSSWSALGSGVTTTSGSTPSVSALLLNGSYLYAAGSFTNAGGAYAAGLAKWDGTNWFGLGSGLYFSVASGPGSGHSLASVGNDVYLGGLFSTAGDKPATSIARWNDQLNFYPAPHLQLTRSVWLTNRQFQFRLAGTSGQSYILQASTNLSSWAPILTNSATLYDFTDTNAAKFPKRFYRGELGP